MALPNVRELPFIGPWIGKIGHVNDILAMPCGPTVDVWVTAAWINAPTLFWSLLKPDQVSTITARIAGPQKGGRPPGKLPHRRKRTMKAGKWVRVNPNAWLGAGGSTVPLPKGQWSTALFRFFIGTQSVGFYILVADATAEFLVDWTSMAMTVAGCDASPALLAKGEVIGPTIHGDTGNFIPVFWQKTYGSGATFSNSIFFPESATVAFGIGWRLKKWASDPSDNNPNVTTRVIDEDTGEVYESETNAEIAAGDELGIAGLAKIPGRIGTGFRRVQPQLKVTGADVDVGGSFCSVMAIDNVNPTLFADP